MAKQDFPSNIDRRRLLISTAAIAAFRIEPDVEYAEAANVTTAEPLSSTAGVRGLKCLCRHWLAGSWKSDGATKSAGRLYCHFCRFQKSCAEWKTREVSERVRPVRGGS